MHQPCCPCERPRVTLLDALANDEGAGAARAGRRGVGGNRCRGGSRGGRPRGPPVEALTDRSFPRLRHAWRRTYSIPRGQGRIGEPRGNGHPENAGTILWYAREDSNLWPLAPEASALSAELRAQTSREELYSS